MNATSHFIEAVKILHSIATPPEQIARRLHATLEPVLHVIEFGTVPAGPLPAVWVADPERPRQPSPTRISER
ncbi:MAG: hypothetical protein ABGZ53_36915 [Fuerstiella sp.]